MNDDLISRQAVDDAIYDYSRSCDVNYAQIMEYIDKIPSVNPQKTQMIDKSNFDQEQYKSDLQCAYDCGKASVNPQEPKTGHWIAIDEEPHEDYECDRCGYVCSTFTANIKPNEEYKFCPNCGCRMVEPQESEEISDRNMKMWEEIFKAESDHKCHTCKHYTSGEHDGSCGSYICKGYSNWESEGEK